MQDGFFSNWYLRSEKFVSSILGPSVSVSDEVRCYGFVVESMILQGYVYIVEDAVAGVYSSGQCRPERSVYRDHYSVLVFLCVYPITQRHGS